MQKTLITILRKLSSGGMQYPSEQHYTSMNSMVYSKAEVYGRADEMSRLLAAVETGAPGAQENYEKYTQDAAAATREAMKVCFSLNHFIAVYI
jgi:hypothetical protein